jgi:hypothetical protein
MLPHRYADPSTHPSLPPEASVSYFDEDTDDEWA